MKIPKIIIENIDDILYCDENYRNRAPGISCPITPDCKRCSAYNKYNSNGISVSSLGDLVLINNRRVCSLTSLKKIRKIKQIKEKITQ